MPESGNIMKKIVSYVKKSRRMKMCVILAALYFVAVIAVENDAWLYHTSIAKLTKVKTSVSGEVTSTRENKETEYRQKIKAIIINGKNKGKEITLFNEYTYTELVNQKYREGQKVLLNSDESGIREVKRDTELMTVLGFLLVSLVFITGKQGVLTSVTVVLNIVIFAIPFLKMDDISSNALTMCSRIVFLFIAVTLFGLNGIQKKTWAALISTICVLAMTMGMFDLVINHVEELDYSTMEYLDLRNLENPEEIFRAEILLSGLGAIMDVTVAISTALDEIVRKRPEVTLRELFRSGREIGYDIMGTMINVLLFVFVSGLIPMCLIRMNNSVHFITILKLHIPCEICRFLVESIGIIWSIPVAVFVSTVMMKLHWRKGSV